MASNTTRVSVAGLMLPTKSSPDGRVHRPWMELLLAWCMNASPEPWRTGTPGPYSKGGGATSTTCSAGAPRGRGLRPVPLHVSTVLAADLVQGAGDLTQRADLTDLKEAREGVAVLQGAVHQSLERPLSPVSVSRVERVTVGDR